MAENLQLKRLSAAQAGSVPLFVVPQIRLPEFPVEFARKIPPLETWRQHTQAELDSWRDRLQRQITAALASIRSELSR